MKSLNIFPRYVMLICILISSITMISLIARPSSIVASREDAKIEEKQEPKTSQIPPQEKAMQKRAERIINARDKLWRGKGANIYQYGNKKIIDVKGVVKPDIETRTLPSARQKIKPKKPVMKCDKKLEKDFTFRRETEVEDKPKKEIIEEQVENFVYKGEKEYISKPNEKIPSNDRHISEANREIYKPSSKKEYPKPANARLITLNNNLQYDLQRNAYIYWVTPVPYHN